MPNQENLNTYFPSNVGISGNHIRNDWLMEVNPNSSNFRNFNVGDRWLNFVAQRYWIMVQKTATSGTWIEFAGALTPIEEFQVDAVSAPGVNPVLPTAGGLVTIQGAAVANHSVPLETRTRALNAYNIEVQEAAAAAATDATKSGIAHFNSARFTVDANGFVDANGSGLGETITGNTGGALSPTAGNWNILGVGDSSTSGSGSTLSIFSPNTAHIIVDPVANFGNYTTIAAAITAAVSGQTIFIRPGTYTENLTLKAGVNLAAFTGDESTPNVTIIGKASFASAGSVGISNIRLQTTSDFFLAITGSAASSVTLNNCYLNCLNNTGISFTSSSGSSVIQILNCQGDIATTGISLFAQSASGIMYITGATVTNSGNSTTASTISAGTLILYYSRFDFPITSSATGIIDIQHSWLKNDQTNTTALIHGGGATSHIDNTFLTSGTASALSIGTSLMVRNSDLSTSNATAVTGAGTLDYVALSFSSTSSVMNTSTQTGRFMQIGSYNAKTQAFCRAYLAGNSTNATGDGTTINPIVFDTTDANVGANYNVATGLFTATDAGVYAITANIGIGAVGAGHTLGIVSLRKNGAGTVLDATLNPANVAGSTNFLVMEATSMIALAVGDTLSAAVQISNSTKTITIAGGTAATQLCIYKIA